MPGNDGRWGPRIMEDESGCLKLFRKESPGFRYSWSEKVLGEFHICDIRRGDLECVKYGGKFQVRWRCETAIEQSASAAWGTVLCRLESDLGSTWCPLTPCTMQDLAPTATGFLHDGWWGAYSRSNDRTKLRMVEILGSKSVTVLKAVA